MRMAIGGAAAGITPRTIVFSCRLAGGCEGRGGGGAGWAMGGACIAGGGALCIEAGGGAGWGMVGACIAGCWAWGAGGTVAAACEAGVDGGCSGRHQVGSSLAVGETCQSAGVGGWVGTEEGGTGAAGGAGGDGGEGAVSDSALGGGGAAAGLGSSGSGAHQPGSDAAVWESFHAGLSGSAGLSFRSSSLIPDLPIDQRRRPEPAAWRTSARAGAAFAPPHPF